MRLVGCRKPQEEPVLLPRLQEYHWHSAGVLLSEVLPVLYAVCHPACRV